MAMLLLVAGERARLVPTKKAPTRGISVLRSHRCLGYTRGMAVYHIRNMFSEEPMTSKIRMDYKRQDKISMVQYQKMERKNYLTRQRGGKLVFLGERTSWFHFSSFPLTFPIKHAQCYSGSSVIRLIFIEA